MDNTIKLELLNELGFDAENISKAIIVMTPERFDIRITSYVNIKKDDGGNFKKVKKVINRYRLVDA